MLSVVIPTVNAASTLEATLMSLSGSGVVGEVIVIDGGSRDFTRTIAERRGARVVDGERGRGNQLALGAVEAVGDWLLFLHADTVLAPGWAQVLADFMSRPGSQRRAGYFRFALDDHTPAAHRLERLVAWRCRRFGLPYGDQGLALSRAFYDELGGFRPLPLMEDVDLARRIGAERLEPLPAKAVTSATRYREAGYLLRPLRNLACLGLYFAGVPPRLLVPLYGA